MSTKFSRTFHLFRNPSFKHATTRCLSKRNAFNGSSRLNYAIIYLHLIGIVRSAPALKSISNFRVYLSEANVNSRQRSPADNPFRRDPSRYTGVTKFLIKRSRISVLTVQDWSSTRIFSTKRDGNIWNCYVSIEFPIENPTEFDDREILPNNWLKI